MFDKKHIGHAFEPYDVEVEKGAVRLFAKAIGETNPVNTDEEAARAAGHRSVVAPLTFIASLVALSPYYFPIAALLGFSEENVLHVGQEYEYFGEICVGDCLTLQETIVDIFTKKNGTLNFVISETMLRNPEGELVALSRETIMVREG